MKITFIERAMRNNTVVITIVLSLMLVGIVALIKMPRNEMPVFTIRQGLVVGVYPGASSEQVAEQLTTAVENYTFGYKEVKKSGTYSYSREGMMYMFVELTPECKDADEFWSKYKHGLDQLKSTLPSGVLMLFANSDFGDTSALLITLSSDNHTYKDLELQLKKLEAEVRKIPATSKVKHVGLQKEKIFVNVDPDKLNEYNIKSLSLLSAFQANGLVGYAGNIDDGETQLNMHFGENFESEKDLAEQIVYSDPDGNVVRLKDIATIERRYEDPDSYIKQNGRKTILLSLEMQNGNNIVEYGEAVDKAIETFKAQLPDGIDVEKISELPKYVKESVNDFMREFLIAIVCVICVTMLLLPLRVASVAGITVPISVLITLAVLYFCGITLEMVSLASLILVLGMIVDNSIVVIDNHVEMIDHGLSPWHSAIKSAKELSGSVIVATIAIICVYVPLGFMIPGSAGEFLEIIPTVVAIALVISVIVALLMVPYLNFVFIKKGLKKHSENEDETKQRRSFLDVMQGVYDRLLERSFKHRGLMILATLAIIGVSLWGFTTIDQELFPKMERNQFAVEIYLPTGSSLKQTEVVVDSVEKLLLNDSRVTNVTSFIGTSSPRFHTVYAPKMPAPNFGQLLVNTVSNQATKDIVRDYETTYSDRFAEAHVKWKILAMQFTSSPIEIRISSDSINDIHKVEKQIFEIVNRTDGIGWARTDWDQMQQNVRIDVDRDKANRMGISKSLIATSLLAGFNSLPLTTIWEGDYPVDVELTMKNEGETDGIESLENKYIMSPKTFTTVPLRSIATLRPEWNEGTVVHRNGVPTLTIVIDEKPGYVASNILNEMMPQIAALDLPVGTSISYGGDYEGTEEVFVPMGIALGLSIILIFFVLLFQFKKFKVVLLIMSGMLMTIPGAVIGLKLMGYPFSITAFVGITSLCGMIVRNGIILIDYARELRDKEKLTVREAAIAAGKRRMRPIFLTSAAAAMGVVPMIISRSPLWGPLGTVICFGLLVSMVLALFILPILYDVSYDDKLKKPDMWSVPYHPKFAKFGVVVLLVGASALIANRAEAQPISLDSLKHAALLNNQQIKQSDLEIEAAEQQKKEAFTKHFPTVSAAAVAMKSVNPLIDMDMSTDNMLSSSPTYNGMMEQAAQLQQMQASGQIEQLQQAAMAGNAEAAAKLQQISELSTKMQGMQSIMGTMSEFLPIIQEIIEDKKNSLDYMNTAALTVAMPLYAGGRIHNGNKLAALAEDVSHYKKDMAVDEVMIRTEELYWTLQSLIEKGKTVQEYKNMLDTLYRDVNNYVEAGLAQRNDLLKVQLKQNELETNYRKVQNGIELTKRAICQHVGIPYTDSIEFEPAHFDRLVEVSQSTTEELVEGRKEYQLLNKAVEAQELQKKMIRGEYMPQVAVAGAGYWLDMMDNRSTNALGMLTVTIPLTDWWGGSHKIKQQNVKLEQARMQLSEKTELMNLQIRQMTDELSVNDFQISVSQKSVDQAQENLTVSQNNYQAGVIGISDLLEAQAVYQQAKDNLTEANCNYQITAAKYLVITGNYK
ncbi:MAG: efflux RND transporter permease subunit [Salinivirgaceae bacterium]|nr:efflux RND transporter permease subunit [Salinivirgaceae bacterium]